VLDVSNVRCSEGVEYRVRPLCSRLTNAILVRSVSGRADIGLICDPSLPTLFQTQSETSGPLSATRRRVHQVTLDLPASKKAAVNASAKQAEGVEPAR
jgi:hypothetical protein